MKKFVILFLFFLFKLSLAQVLPFFNGQQVGEGFFIGVEIINKDNNKILNPKEFIFQWKIPAFNLTFSKSSTNILFFKTQNKNIQDFKEINLTLKQSKSKKIYQLNGEPNLLLPKAKIVKKVNGLILPLGGSVKKDESLTVITKNFSKKDFQYIWHFNNALVSNKKDVFIKELSEKKGIIKVKVVNSLGEEATDSLYFTVE